MAWIVVGVTLRERSAKLEGLISIRGDIHVHGTFEIAFLLLLTLPSVPPKKTLNILGPLLTSCGVCLQIHALQIHIEIFLIKREGAPKTGRLQYILQPWGKPM